ncbi:MAG: Nucleoporin nup84 [Icmadophila ericetorum]|nr:Nucleoporin nup84 [Icmadophila ericetorum]
MDVAGSPGSLTLLTVNDVHRALHPLQVSADRVGKQVEQFAETLDRLSKASSQKSARDCRRVLPFISGYEKIASETVKRLRKEHEPAQQEKFKKSFSRRLRGVSGTSTPNLGHEDGAEDGTHTTVKDLQRWEQELQTWQLLGLMTQVRNPAPHTASNPAPGDTLNRPRKDAGIHRYSSEQDLWESFLAEDDTAWERHVIVEWLKQCADGAGKDIDTVIQDLDVDSERGEGLWSHGWLYSKEAIKAQKRLRSWPQALDPNTPGIDASLMNSARTEGLVTQLDPDAVTRQQRSLQKEDLSFERAMWLACWEMYRRGHSWESIREWCKERNEVWRAVTMRGALQGVVHLKKRSPGDMHNNWQSRSLWRRMCAITAKEGGIDEFENAIYGALSGYLPSVHKVCRTWDDYLFAEYNSYLVNQFDQYEQARLPNRLPHSRSENISAPNPAFSSDVAVRSSGKDMITKLSHFEPTRSEARLPVKTLQGCLIGGGLRDYFIEYGIKLSQVVNDGNGSKIIKRMGSELLKTDIIAEVKADDYNMLRVLAHVILISQELGGLLEKGDSQQAIENIIVAYIDFLGQAGKQQLLPMYASRLSSRRATDCMARQLPYIVDPAERHTVMKLMKDYNMDVLLILNKQLQFIIYDMEADPSNTAAFPPLDLLDTKSNRSKSVVPVKEGFMQRPITDDELDLLHGYEWYLLLTEDWNITMTTGVIMYKHLLRTRSYAASRELTRSISFSRISLAKTEALLGRTIDLSQPYSLEEDESDSQANLRRSTRVRDSSSQKEKRSTPDRRKQADKIELLLSQAKIFRDLEQLFVALDALEAWSKVAKLKHTLTDPRHARGFKSDLQKAHDRLGAAIEPLLHGWLIEAPAENPDPELPRIRTACLPSTLLAYISTLNFDAHALSREMLLKCMDVAALIAAPDSDMVETFMESKRMAELVDALAVTSLNIVRAEERGRKVGGRGVLRGSRRSGGRGGKGRGATGGELGIWTTGMKERGVDGE